MRQIQLREWERQAPDVGSPLRGVFLEDPAVRRVCEELAQRDMLIIEERRYGLSVQATSFVGRIDLGPLQITIQPKIETPRLLTLLRYAYGLRWLEPSFSATHLTTATTFQELLIVQLALEVQELQSRGLHRTYRPTREALASPRGQIDLNALACQGGVAPDRFTCMWYPRSEDCLPNQILLQGMRLGAQLTQSRALRAQLQRLAAPLAATVTPVALNRQTFARYRRETNRLVAAYQPALALIELLSEGQGILLDSADGTVQLPGFLFDMNHFFQALIARFLTEYLPDYEVQEEYRLAKLFAYDPAHNPNHRRAPTPRPDFAVSHGHTTTAFLDTKYRDLWEESLPTSMLYQLAIYALSGSAGDTATILYPTSTAAAREAQIIVYDPIRATQRATVVLRPVNLHAIEAAISPTSHRQAEALATHVVFGAHPPPALEAHASYTGTLLGS